MQQIRRTKQPHPSFPSIKIQGVCCFLQAARKAAQHCMEGLGEGKLHCSLLKSAKRQPGPTRGMCLNLFFLPIDSSKCLDIITQKLCLLFNISVHSCYLLKGLDPYALVTCEGKTVRTPTLSDTANPEWNSGALFFVRRPKKTHLVIQVLCRCFYQQQEKRLSNLKTRKTSRTRFS